MGRKNTESKNQKIAKTKTGNILLLSNCAWKKSKFIKEQEGSRLSSSLGIKTYLSKISLVGPVLF